MNKNLLKLVVLGMAVCTISCSEAEERSEDEINENENIAEALTDCLQCPGYTVEERVASNNNELVTIVVPKAEVCKGADGKAYIDGTINENDLDYDDYVSNRQLFLPCASSN